jgi:hypothetical protein
MSRRAVFIWTSLILFINHIVAVMTAKSSASVDQIFAQLCAVGLFQYMAWYAIFRLLGSSDRRPRARPKDAAVIMLVCLLVVLPAGQMVWMSATVTALYLWTLGNSDPKLRAAGAVLAALSVQQLWGHVFYNLVAFRLLRAETAVVGGILQASGTGTLWHDNIITEPSGFGIAIFTECSSFHNVSVALLCWVTVSRLHGHSWSRRDFTYGGLIAATMVCFNIARLSFMALDPDLYGYWHDGMGATIFAAGASFTILLLSLLGARAQYRT